MAYDIIKRLEKEGKRAILEKLQKAVSRTSKSMGKLHEVWEESIDWNYCETLELAYQKLAYMHNNPCTGKWMLASYQI